MGNEIRELLEDGKGFKDLSLEDLKRGYIKQDKPTGYRCIFCGEFFEDGVIYSSRERNVLSDKAAQEHVEDIHEGTFQSLIKLDKQISGLSDVQKKVIESLYAQEDVKDIADSMGISPATVRAHKFNLQKMKREAKIFLALMDAVEERAGQLVDKDRNGEENTIEKITGGEEMFNINFLHPFLNQWGIK